MRKLDSVDAQLLDAETETTFTHVGVLLIAEPDDQPGGQPEGDESGDTAGGEPTVDQLRAFLDARSHRLPALRRRLGRAPFGLDVPFWVDARVDLGYHVCEVGLPEPGDDEQLAEQIARITARPLERTRPLWECYLISGLRDGRVAVFVKAHRAVLEGRAGADALAQIFGPERGADEAARSTGANRVSALGRALWDTALVPGRAVLAAPKVVPTVLSFPAVRDLPGMGALHTTRKAVDRLTGHDVVEQPTSPPPAPPDTPFNGPISAHRRYAFTSLPMGEIRSVGRSQGWGTTDVLTAVCTSALRSWLIEHEALPDAPIVAATPVATVDAGHRRSEHSSRPAGPDALLVTSLPTDVEDPARRTVLLHTRLAEGYRRIQATPQGLLHTISTALPPLAPLTRLALKAIATGSPPINVLISLIPGPGTSGSDAALRIPGARVTACVPVPAISDVTGGLAVSGTDYGDRLYVGVVACREMVPDLWTLASRLRFALKELADNAGASGTD